ncbi:MAG: hypothetical protein ABSH11_03175 [Verrucomicrobiota bacterium]|jgi:hypothetical protein
MLKRIYFKRARLSRVVLLHLLRDCSKLPNKKDVKEGVTRRIEPLMSADSR